MTAGSENYPINPNDWAFLDIGFSGKSKTSGLLLPGMSEAKNVLWKASKTQIIECAKQKSGALHLMIEAPLSMAFDQAGNPIGRKFEKRGNKTRYWYLQGGAVTMVAASLLIADAWNDADVNIILYEAFLSFKTQKTDHKADAVLMRDAIGGRNAGVRYSESIKLNTSDKLFSSTHKFGMDFGIPPTFLIDVDEIKGTNS